MKKTAETFYKVAKIIAIILIPVYAVVATVYLGVAIYDIVKELEWAHDLGKSIGYFFYSIFEIVVLIVTSIQFKRMAEDPTDKAPHIVYIVFGVLGGNPFFIVGAILSIILICQQENPEQVEAEKKEEPAEEVKEEKAE